MSLNKNKLRLMLESCWGTKDDEYTTSVFEAGRISCGVHELNNVCNGVGRTISLFGFEMGCCGVVVNHHHALRGTRLPSQMPRCRWRARASPRAKPFPL